MCLPFYLLSSKLISSKLYLNLDKIQVNGAIFLWNMAEKTGGMACFADAEACFASK
jgi:hypothetical protein